MDERLEELIEKARGWAGEIADVSAVSLTHADLNELQEIIDRLETLRVGQWKDTPDQLGFLARYHSGRAAQTTGDRRIFHTEASQCLYTACARLDEKKAAEPPKEEARDGGRVRHYVIEGTPIVDKDGVKVGEMPPPSREDQDRLHDLLRPRPLPDLSKIIVGANAFEVDKEVPDEYLRPFGWAPGGYMNKCLGCGETQVDGDKRATCCRPCAKDRYLRGLLRVSEIIDPAGYERARSWFADAKRINPRGFAGRESISVKELEYFVFPAMTKARQILGCT